MTRFGEMSPFWQYFKSLRLLYEGLFSVERKFEPALVEFLLLQMALY